MRNRYVLGTLIVLVLALAGVATLFVIQNSARTTQLSLDLGFAAWQFAQPVSVPILVGTCLGAGLVLGLVVAGWWSMRSAARRRAADLDQVRGSY